MKPSQVRYFLPAVAVLAIAFLVWYHKPNEPMYQGKALTQWINEAHDVGIFEQTDETKTAMLAFGTNAVPFLLKEFTRPISGRRGRLYAWVNSRPFFNIHLRTDEERVIVAGRGLMLLETNAAPALPVLAGYFDDPTRDAFVMDIFYSLGDVALPCVAVGLASTNAMAITNALKTLQLMASRSDSARAALVAAMSHSSPAARSAADTMFKTKVD